MSIIELYIPSVVSTARRATIMLPVPVFIVMVQPSPVPLLNSVLSQAKGHRKNAKSMDRTKVTNHVPRLAYAASNSVVMVQV